MSAGLCPALQQGKCIDKCSLSIQKAALSNNQQVLVFMHCLAHADSDARTPTNLITEKYNHNEICRHKDLGQLFQTQMGCRQALS